MRRIVLTLLLLLATSSVFADELARLHRLAASVTWSKTPPPTPADFNPAAAKTFNVTARQWNFTFSPSPFVVNQGDSVTLNISVPNNDGSSHGFFLENYMSGGVIIDRGRSVTVNFIANDAGTFFFFCTFECGAGHSGMNGTFMVSSVAPPAPTITSFAPASGPTTGGTVVAIGGTNFQNGATVRFGGVAAVSTTVNSSTSITAINPAHGAGPVAVTVTNPDAQTGTASTSFTYEVAAPTITSFNPASGPTAGGTAVTITGTNFQNGSIVRFGGDAAGSTTVNSSTSITATSPAHGAGSVVITVTNPDGQNATSASAFTYEALPPPPPLIASFTPTWGPPEGGTRVTITGSNFTAGVEVTFGGVGAPVVAQFPTTLTVVTPVHAAGAVSVTVTNRDGQSSTAATAFTYVASTTAAPKRRRAIKR